MTDKKILSNAIDKAIDNGYITPYSQIAMDTLLDSRGLFAIIFSHSFAKAFWGNLPLMCYACKREHDDLSDCDAGMYCSRIYHWQYHLQQMVLEKEPLKCLEQFL